MEPEPEKVDLSALDLPGWDRKIASVSRRAFEQRRLRRAVVRRGAIAVVLAAAAAIAVWFGAPKREAVAYAHADLLEWAVRDALPSEVLGLGGNDAR